MSALTFTSITYDLRLSEGDSAEDFEYHNSNLEFVLARPTGSKGDGKTNRFSWNHESSQEWREHIQSYKGQKTRPCEDNVQEVLQSIIFVVARIIQVGIIKTRPMIFETKNAHPFQSLVSTQASTQKHVSTYKEVESRIQDKWLALEP